MTVDEALQLSGLLTKTGLARYLGVHPNTVNGWARKGEIPEVARLAVEGLVHRRTLQDLDRVLRRVLGL